MQKYEYYSLTKFYNYKNRILMVKVCNFFILAREWIEL